MDHDSGKGGPGPESPSGWRAIVLAPATELSPDFVLLHSRAFSFYSHTGVGKTTAFLMHM